MKHAAHPYPRRVRLEAQFHQELATWLLREAESPWNERATITRVELTPDSSIATVYVLVHGDEAVHGGDTEAAVAYLNDEAGRLRGMLGRGLRLRRVPQIRFRYDRPFDQAADVEAALAKIHDERVARGEPADPVAAMAATDDDEEDEA